MLPSWRGGDILALLLGKVVLTHHKPLPDDEQKKALIFLELIKGIYPGQVHIWDDGKEPIEWAEKFVCANKIFSSICLNINIGKLNRLKETENPKIIHLKRIVNSGAIPGLDQGLQKNFILFIELLTYRFKKGDVFNWIRDSRILQWLKTRGIEVDEKVISCINPPKDDFQPSPSSEPQEPTPSENQGQQIANNKSSKTHPAPKTKKGKKEDSRLQSKRHDQSKKEQKSAREIAQKLWREDNTLTIQAVILRDEINRVAPNRPERTIRGWIKDLAPSNKPGRRPEKK